MRGITIQLQYSQNVETAEGDVETIYGKPEAVDNVLVASPTVQETASTRDLYAQNADTKLYMPRTWKFRSLHGARINLPDGRIVQVLGDPYPALTDITPTFWYVRVLARKVN